MQYSERSRTRIAELKKQRCLSFVVGGTGLYIKAMLYGIFQSEPVDPKIRKRLKQELEQGGSSCLYRHMIDFIGGHLQWDESVPTLKRDTRKYAKH